MYVVYNGVLRGLGVLQPRRGEAQWHAEQVAARFGGNLYTTTLHVINSAVVKLSKLTRACDVWRGAAACHKGALRRHLQPLGAAADPK